MFGLRSAARAGWETEHATTAHKTVQHIPRQAYCRWRSMLFRDSPTGTESGGDAPFRRPEILAGRHVNGLFLDIKQAMWSPPHRGKLGGVACLRFRTGFKKLSRPCFGRSLDRNCHTWNLSKRNIANSNSPSPPEGERGPGGEGRSSPGVAFRCWLRTDCPSPPTPLPFRGRGEYEPSHCCGDADREKNKCKTIDSEARCGTLRLRCR